MEASRGPKEGSHTKRGQVDNSVLRNQQRGQGAAIAGCSADQMACFRPFTGSRASYSSLLHIRTLNLPPKSNCRHRQCVSEILLFRF